MKASVYRVSGARLGMAGGTRGQLLPIGWNIALADDPPQSLTQDIVHIVLRLRSGETQFTAAACGVRWSQVYAYNCTSLPTHSRK